MKRIFVAVDISDETREKAAGHVRFLRRAYPDLRVGWERNEKLHLTIKFLGDTEEGALDNLKKSMSRAAEISTPFKITVGGAGSFSRVLWLGVGDPSGKFAKLYSSIENKAARAGFARETRDFMPHLTLARLREPARSGDLIRTHLETKFEPVEFEVRHITIYESRLQPTGSIYSVNSIYYLKG